MPHKDCCSSEYVSIANAYFMGEDVKNTVK